jgi:hypothetical protein
LAINAKGSIGKLRGIPLPRQFTAAEDCIALVVIDLDVVRPGSA